MTHIDAMKQALKFVEQNTYGGDDVTNLMTALRIAIEQAEKQEPVACEKCGKAIKDGKVKCVQGRNCWVGQQPAQRTKQEPVINKSAAIRIATALGWEPKREWVGLTDEQKEALSQDAEGNPWAAVELAEAKLKELNT